MAKIGTCGPGQCGTGIQAVLCLSAMPLTQSFSFAERGTYSIFSFSHKVARQCDGPVNDKYKVGIKRHMIYLKYACIQMSSNTAEGNTSSNVVTIGGTHFWTSLSKSQAHSFKKSP